MNSEDSQQEQLRRKLYQRAIDDCPDDFYNKSADDKGAWFTGGKRGIVTDHNQQFFCEDCKCLLSNNQCFICTDCRHRQNVNALQNHIVECQAFLGGKYGPLELDELNQVLKQLQETQQQLTKLIEGKS